MDRLRELNDSQRDAVQTLSGPLLVLAGAGTGKTRVITYRTAELIRNGTPPDRILCVTFTNKAAREMQARSAALLGRRLPAKPLVTTFHSLCVRILRQEIGCLGYPTDFAICDRNDQESAARTALREIRVTEKTLKPGDLVNRISRWKTAGVRPSEAADNVEDALDCLAASGYRRYQQGLRARGAVDFDDLLMLTHDIFRESPQALARHQSRFDHVQIDEYQDTNGIQFSIVESLVARHRSIAVVGDDDQSIYGWRGAELRHILEFHHIFPGAKIVRLEQNYRSNPAILAIANNLALHNVGRHEKRLEAHKRGGGGVRFACFDDEQVEADIIVREIASLIEAGASPGDIAILFRTNEQPRLFESELRRRRVPYVLVGGQSFFDRREIRDLLSYLRVLVRPDDDVALRRIVNTPPRGVGDTTAEKIVTRAVHSGCGFWDALPAAIAAGEVNPRAKAGLEGLRALIDQYREQLAESPGALSEVFGRLLNEIAYEAEIERVHKEPEQQLSRKAAVQQLRDAISEYVAREAEPTLALFLDDCALTGRDEENDKEDKHAGGAVRLMTLHSAKGLEFPRVYLVGLEEGLLPHRRSLETSEDSISEERRLAYVGVTRAMDELAITWAGSRMKWGKRRPTIPSRFIREMRQDPNGDDDDTTADVESHSSPERAETP